MIIVIAVILGGSFHAFATRADSIPQRNMDILKNNSKPKVPDNTKSILSKNANSNTYFTMTEKDFIIALNKRMKEKNGKVVGIKQMIRTNSFPTTKCFT